jgi:hypothetical protein
MSGHRGSPRRAPEASLPTFNPSRQTRPALSLSIALVPHATQQIAPALCATSFASGMDARRVKTRSSRGFSEADSPARRADAPWICVFQTRDKEIGFAPSWTGPTLILSTNRRAKAIPIGCRQRRCRKSLIFMNRPFMVATSRIKGAPMATQMTKSQLIEQISTKNELAKKDVKGVIETLAEIG